MHKRKIGVADLKTPSVLLATWFGCGLVPKAPGTWGSLGAIPPALALFYYGGLDVFIAGLLLVGGAGYYAARAFEKLSGEHDSKMIVIDEVAGQWIALLPVFLWPGPAWFSIPLAFALFRFFDILKPGPVGWVDKNVLGAAGVMGDDVLAGLLAGLLLSGVLYAGFG